MDIDSIVLSPEADINDYVLASISVFNRQLDISTKKLDFKKYPKLKSVIKDVIRYGLWDENNIFDNEKWVDKPKRLLVSSDRTLVNEGLDYVLLRSLDILNGGQYRTSPMIDRNMNLTDYGMARLAGVVVI